MAEDQDIGWGIIRVVFWESKRDGKWMLIWPLFLLLDYSFVE